MKRTLLLITITLLSLGLRVNAQQYHIGQVVDNPDGSRGVVFYLNEDGTDGWMVALHDAALPCPWGVEGHIEGLSYVTVENGNYFNTVFADADGYANTMLIRDYHESIGYTGQYAAGAVDFENGWYLPTTKQLKMLYVNATLYEPYLESVGEVLGLHPYWTSTVVSETKAWYVHFGAPYPEFAWAWNGYYRGCDKSANYDSYSGAYLAVRAVRNLDFLPTPHIGKLYAPEVICGSGPLELVTPNLFNADSYGWEIAVDEAFTNPIAYTGQLLDETYDGWYLRLWATNEEGTSYSNVVQISVHYPTEGSENVETCKAYLWNGQTYTATGTYQTMLTNQWGCDSIATLHLTIIGPISNEINVTACEHYVWNSIEYTESGDYNQLFQTQGDCDSVVTMHLTINQPDEYFIPYPIYACDVMEWGSMTLTESGAYTQTFTNQLGCDSIVTMSLFINQNVHHEFMDLGCGEYNWNGEIYTQSGEYQQTFTASNGCDSIVTLHLTLKEMAPVSQIHGESQIYYGDYGLYTYSIDPVPGCFGYSWTIDNDWQITHSDSNECTVNINYPGTATLTVKVYTECGYIERTLRINHDVRPTVAVYPNPTADQFFIKLSGMRGKVDIEVHDYLGQFIDRFTRYADIQGVEIPYSLQGKAAGVYLISITNDYSMFTKKVVKTTAASIGLGY